MKKFYLSAAVLFLCVTAGAKESEDALEFYQAQSRLLSENKRQDQAYAAALADALSVWQKRFPQDKQNKDALLLQADLFVRAQDYPSALAALLKSHYLFPVPNDSALLSSRVEAVMNELDKDQKGQALKLLAANVDSLNKEQRQDAYLRALYSIDTPDMYAVTAQEIDEFLAQNPGYAQNDKIEILYGDLPPP